MDLELLQVAYGCRGALSLRQEVHLDLVEVSHLSAQLATADRLERAYMPHPVMVPKPRARMITREKSTGEDAYLRAMVNSLVLRKGEGFAATHPQ